MWCGRKQLLTERCGRDVRRRWQSQRPTTQCAYLSPLRRVSWAAMTFGSRPSKADSSGRRPPSSRSSDHHDACDDLLVGASATGQAATVGRAPAFRSGVGRSSSVPIDLNSALVGEDHAPSVTSSCAIVLIAARALQVTFDFTRRDWALGSDNTLLSEPRKSPSVGGGEDPKTVWQAQWRVRQWARRE